MNANLDKLVQISRDIGGQIAYVQGGGGNTSIKIDDHAMFIKASGKFLADIDAATGFLPVDWPMINASVKTCQTDHDYDKALVDSSLVGESAVRPSIETGFHALLGTCVIHSHSVWANLLTCSLQGEALVNELFPSAIWVPYATPGLQLTNMVAKVLDGREDIVMFLQNHGVLISGPTEDAAFSEHSAVTTRIRQRFPDLIAFDDSETDNPNRKIEGLLFPDQAIYHSNDELAKSRAGQETLSACAFLVDRIAQAGLTIQYIDNHERDVLLAMESEKYRQRITEV